MSQSIVVNSTAAEKAEKELLAQHQEDVTRLLAEVMGDDEIEPFVIDDDEDQVFASKLLLHAKKQKKSLEDRRKSVTQPLNSVLSTIRGWFRDPINDWYELEKLLKRRISDYELKKARLEDEAIAQIAEAAQQQDYDKAHQASLVLEKERPKVAGVSTRETWVVDEEKVDLSKVPKEFLLIQLNMTVVREYIRQYGKGRPEDLPGLPFKKDIQVIGSTKG